MNAEQYDLLPNYVKDVLEEFSTYEQSYATGAKIVKALKKIGWTADYDLSAEISGVRMIKYDAKANPIDRNIKLTPVTKEDVTERPEFTETMFNISIKVSEWYGRLDLEDKIMEGFEDSRTLPAYARELAVKFEEGYNKDLDFTVAIDSFIQEELYCGEDVKLPSGKINYSPVFNLDEYDDDDSIVSVTFTKEQFQELRGVLQSGTIVLGYVDGVLAKFKKAMSITPQEHFFTEISRETARTILSEEGNNTNVFVLKDDDSEHPCEEVEDLDDRFNYPGCRFGIEK